MENGLYILKGPWRGAIVQLMEDFSGLGECRREYIDVFVQKRCNSSVLALIHWFDTTGWLGSLNHFTNWASHLC